MEKVRGIYLALLLSAFFFGTANAQEEMIVRKGLIRAMATISPSKMLGNNGAYFYLHGNLEGYLTKNVSVCGEGYYFLGSQKSNSDYDMIHNLFYGFSYHIITSRSDLCIGIQPGMAIVKQKASDGIPDPIIGADPVFSGIVGYNFYVSKFFHFFIQSRLILGEHNYDKHKDLSEFRFSAGLGFNLNTMK